MTKSHRNRELGIRWRRGQAHDPGVKKARRQAMEAVRPDPGAPSRPETAAHSLVSRGLASPLILDHPRKGPHD